MNDKLLLGLLLVRIAAPIIMGVILLFYFILFVVGILYISHAIDHLAPFLQTRNQEIESMFKELQNVQQTK